MPMRSLFNRSKGLFNLKPTLTLSLINGSLSAVADLLGQTMNPKYDKNNNIIYNRDSIVRFFIFGAVLAPPLNKWNTLLEFKLPLKSPGTLPKSPLSKSAVFKRVVADQSLMAPAAISSFILTIGMMEGKDVKELKQKYNNLFLPTLIDNWKIWPLVQTVNFSVIPLNYRVPFSGCFGVAWTIYLSIINSKSNSNKTNV